jgi:HK97 family phage major capsid protein
MIRALEQAQLFFGGMRSVATIIRTDTGATLPFPTVNETTVKGRILGINTQATATDPAFGIMNLGAFKYSSDMVLVPEELLQDSGVNMPVFLGNALGMRIARITNQHWTTGTGTTQPWGIVPRATAKNLGTGTATTFGASTTAIYQNLVGIVHAVDIAYRRNAKFMMNDAVLAIFAGLVDSTGRPIWAPSLAQDVPDRLMGYPVVINNDMTPTLVNLARTVVFGDLSSYYIREVRDVAVLSSRERFIDFHQTAFLAFGRYDGDLLNAGGNPVVAAVHQT